MFCGDEATQLELLKPLADSISQNWSEDKIRDSYFIFKYLNEPQNMVYNQLYEF